MRRSVTTFFNFLFSTNAGDYSIYAQNGTADEATTPDSDDDLLEDVGQGSASGSHLPLLLSETPGIGTTRHELRRVEVADATSIRYLSFFIISAISMTLSLFDNAWVITASQVRYGMRMNAATAVDVVRLHIIVEHTHPKVSYFYPCFLLPLLLSPPPSFSTPPSPMVLL
jgi:hypothetical protein